MPSQNSAEASSSARQALARRVDLDEQRAEHGEGEDGAHENEAERHHQGRALHHGNVAGQHGVHQSVADPGPGKQDLDNHDAFHEQGELHA